jgi:extracellular factor (EF) 3-hydroxypalmitic acid methyl ester biosynthesis protein
MLSFDKQISAERSGWQQELEATLDQVFDSFCTAPSSDTIDWLARRLGEIFDLAVAADHLLVFKDICKSHSLARLALEDPYVRRAVEKPRGYAGDAVMLDYIYRPQPISASSVGLAMHEATTSLSSAKSILWRRDYLAKRINITMERASPTQILAVASGHMRELDFIPVLPKREALEITAVDLDQTSLKECMASYPAIDIRPVHSSAVTIRRAKLPETFHLVYCAGLFDYLNEATSEFVLAQLYRQLLPSGLLCVANFTPDNHGRGFMEGFMDWSLILRNEQDLTRIAKSAVPGCALSVFRDPYGNIAYLEMRKPWSQ